MKRITRSGFVALLAAAAVALAGCASMEDFATNPEKREDPQGRRDTARLPAGPWPA